MIILEHGRQFIGTATLPSSFILRKGDRLSCAPRGDEGREADPERGAIRIGVSQNVTPTT
jgi:hypothetical protein